jgi:hypothetical protein
VEPLPHGSRFHPKTKSNLWRRQSLLTQGEHLLIALLSLCTLRGNGLLHTFLLGGPPFFNRQEAACWRLRRRFDSLAGRFHLEGDTCEELLDGFRQVPGYMEAISHLNRLRSASSYCAGANGRYTLPQRQLSPSDLAGQLSSSDCSELEIVLLLPDVSSSQKMTSPFDMLSHLISSLWSSLRGTGLSLPIARQVSPSFFRIAASSSFRIGQGQSHFCRKKTLKAASISS